ncbi:MAG TPA: hypothetical protein ENJ45_00220, partial [Phaeodactylibacter sp.]|nr:hypothetical protein [Phaeodactylibacter sp.]
MNYYRIFDLFVYQKARFAQKEALLIRQGKQWKAFSTEQCLHWIDRLSAAFLQSSVKRGDAIAIVSESGSPWWNFVDMAAQQVGLIPVPIHAASSIEDIRFILDDAPIRIVFCHTKKLYEKVMLAQS